MLNTSVLYSHHSCKLLINNSASGFVTISPSSHLLTVVKPQYLFMIYVCSLLKFDEYKKNCWSVLSLDHISVWIIGQLMMTSVEYGESELREECTQSDARPRGYPATWISISILVCPFVSFSVCYSSMEITSLAYLHTQIWMNLLWGFGQVRWWMRKLMWIYER